MPSNVLPIRILMAVHNGAAHLQAQLDSLVAQDHGDWVLDAADDGSGDDTAAILARFADSYPDHAGQIGQGPGQGSAANFLTLLARGVAAAPDAAMAFADQDDVWLPGKLSRAAAWLSEHGAQDGAALAWVCRTTLTDASLTPIGESRHFPRPPSFGNALVQNILAGNTIVLSPAAARAVAQTVPAALEAGVPYHDWWVYQVVTGMGGRVGMEAEPLVLYRQHGANSLGHHGPVRGRLKRLGIITRRKYSGWLDANLAALEANHGLLNAHNHATLDSFVAARAGTAATLARTLPRLGIHRQTSRGDRMLQLMALAGRL